MRMRMHNLNAIPIGFSELRSRLLSTSIKEKQEQSVISWLLDNTQDLSDAAVAKGMVAAASGGGGPLNWQVRPAKKTHAKENITARGRKASYAFQYRGPCSAAWVRLKLSIMRSSSDELV